MFKLININYPETAKNSKYINNDTLTVLDDKSCLKFAAGINHDDITSMSSAQIALISMIISISLLSQTSTKLNIIVGDEIDAPFDSENRREFIDILTQLMSLVKSSQCVLISHNSEIPMADCDIILLKNENDVITEGNIIWSYK